MNIYSFVAFEALFCYLIPIFGHQMFILSVGIFLFYNHKIIKFCLSQTHVSRHLLGIKVPVTIMNTVLNIFYLLKIDNLKFKLILTNWSTTSFLSCEWSFSGSLCINGYKTVFSFLKCFKFKGWSKYVRVRGGR